MCALPLPHMGSRQTTHHAMPVMATAMPANLHTVMTSPKNMTPPDRMITVLRWPMML